MTRFSRTAAAVGAFLFIWGVAASAADPVKTEGRVTDDLLGTPIVHARVRIHDSSGTALTVESDRRGRYHAIGLTSGIVEIAVDAPGYVDTTRRCLVRDGEALRLDFKLYHPLTTISTNQVAPRIRCDIEPDTSDRYVIE